MGPSEHQARVKGERMASEDGDCSARFGWDTRARLRGEARRRRPTTIGDGGWMLVVCNADRCLPAEGIVVQTLGQRQRAGVM